MTPEGEIEAHLKKRVKETGGEVRKLKWIARNGAPDRFVFWFPHLHIPVQLPIFAFVELKAPGKYATPQQEREHTRLKEAGFTVAVLDSKGLVDMFVETMTGSKLS